MYFIVIAALLSLTFFGANTYSTHTSKPVLSVNKTVYSVNEPVSLNGWVDYSGSPISDVLLDIVVVSKNGDIVMREDVKSDPSGNFTTAFMFPPNTSPGNFTVRIISECRVEHMDICSNQETIIPIILTGNSIQTNVEPSNISSSSPYPKKYSSPDKSSILCNGQPATILGTPGNDLFTQISNSDIINSLEGNDTIYISGMGNERVCTSAGDDVVIDNSLGNDIIYGDIGNDEIISFSNYTMINGEEGNDLIIVMGNGKSTYIRWK